MQIAQRGRAALQVCSTVFVAMGRMQASALGQPALPIVAVPHPFGALSREQVRAAAERCARDIAAIVSGRPSQ